MKYLLLIILFTISGCYSNPTYPEIRHRARRSIVLAIGYAKYLKLKDPVGVCTTNNSLYASCFISYGNNPNNRQVLNIICEETICYPYIIH